MNKLLSLFVGLALVGGSVAHAADTSVTITTRKAVTPVATSPVVGYVHADVTAAAVSANRMTFDIPAPRGTANIIGFIPSAQSVSGSAKPLNITRSGNVVTVTGSNATSGTMVVSDTIRVLVVYQP